MILQLKIRNELERELAQEAFQNQNNAIDKYCTDKKVTKGELYERIASKSGYDVESISKRFKGQLKSVRADFILLLEQELGIFRDEILGDNRLPNLRNKEANFEYQYRKINNLAKQDEDIEDKIKKVLNALIRRLEKFFNKYSNKKGRIGNNIQKFDNDIKQIIEFLSRDIEK